MTVLGIRFLVTGEDSHGSASVFEVRVPVGQKLAAPAHKHDAYEEILYGIQGVLTWTVDGTPIEVGPGRPCVSREARCTASIISVTSMSNSSPLYLQRLWDQRISEKRQK